MGPRWMGSSRGPAGALIDRRTWLCAASASLVASQLPGSIPSVAAAENAALQEKARKNIKLGVDTQPYSEFPVAEAARRIAEDGFTGVLMRYAFADVRFDPLAPDWQAVDLIVRTFEQRGIEIAAIHGYVNVIDPVPERRARGQARLACLLENWKRLGCANVSTETGTLSTVSDWADAPENATEDAYAQCRTALEQLARQGEKYEAVVSIEPYWRHVINSIDRTERILRDIQSPALRLVMDPCNYPREEELPQLRSMLDDMFRRVGEYVIIAHAKDVGPPDGGDGPNLSAAGRGVLDYPQYLGLLAGLDRPIYLAVEYAPLDDVPRARDVVRDAFARV